MHAAVRLHIQYKFSQKTWYCVFKTLVLYIIIEYLSTQSIISINELKSPEVHSWTHMEVVSYSRCPGLTIVSLQTMADHRPCLGLLVFTALCPVAQTDISPAPTTYPSTTTHRPTSDKLRTGQRVTL